jgi:hypothetical protein
MQKRILRTVASLPYMARKVFKTISDDVDAGLHDDRLYDKALHPWRAKLRRIMLPLIRTETPYLAAFQVIFYASSYGSRVVLY